MSTVPRDVTPAMPRRGGRNASGMPKDGGHFSMILIRCRVGVLAHRFARLPTAMGEYAHPTRLAPGEN